MYIQKSASFLKNKILNPPVDNSHCSEAESGAREDEQAFPS